ncbi:MAG: TIGR04076 family protein [Pseudomonadota bacterium]
MDKPYEVVIKLLGGDGPCDIGLLPGTEWVFGERTPEGMCTLAFNAMYPLIVGLQNGATFPWQEDPDVTLASCPNPKVNNVYEIRRITKK